MWDSRTTSVAKKKNNSTNKCLQNHGQHALTNFQHFQQCHSLIPKQKQCHTLSAHESIAKLHPEKSHSDFRFEFRATSLKLIVLQWDMNDAVPTLI